MYRTSVAYSLRAHPAVWTMVVFPVMVAQAVCSMVLVSEIMGFDSWTFNFLFVPLNFD